MTLRDKLRAFLRGACSLRLFPDVQPPLAPPPQRSVQCALAEDWDRVGADAGDEITDAQRRELNERWARMVPVEDDGVEDPEPWF